MTATDRPVRMAKRPALFRRLFYREEPFLVLDTAELDALFDAFACVVRLYAAVLYWIRSLNDHEYLVLAFQHRSMVRYSGLEVVHVTPEQIGYYRLPGAMAGGRGTVLPGTYAFAIQSAGRPVHHVRICKCEFGQLHLESPCAGPVHDVQSFHSLKRHVVDRSKFADEMKAVIERGLEWGYQRALVGEPDLLADAEWNEIVRKCTGLSPKADALLVARAELRKAPSRRIEA